MKTLSFEGLTDSGARDHAAQIGAAAVFLAPGVEIRRVETKHPGYSVYAWAVYEGEKRWGMASHSPREALGWACTEVERMTADRERLGQSLGLAHRAASGVAVMQGEQFPGDEKYWPANDARYA